MKHFLLPCLLVAQLVAAAHAQSIDTREIVRRGNRVEVVNSTAAHAHNNNDAAFLAALAPPADDSHKWFITLITLDGCAPCKRLVADWQTSPALTAFAQQRDPKSSWAHLNIYAAEDETQAWRWQNIAVKSYPTILVQPPRSGIYGNAATVVLQKSGYNGQPEQLAEQLRAAIKRHVAKHREGIAKQQSQGVHLIGTCAAELGQTNFTSFEQKSPFAPPVKPSVLPSFDPLPLLPAIPPSVDPDVQPAPQPMTPVEPTPTPLPDLADEKYPQHPEVVVIANKLAELYSNEAEHRQIQRVVARLRAARPGLIVRMLDLRDAKQYPVEPSELPAVLTTSEGRLETKLDRTLLPLIAAEPPPFPWQAVAGLLANGFNWAGIAALAIWGVGMIRARRQAAGKKLLLDDALVQQVRTLVEEFLKGKSAT